MHKLRLAAGLLTAAVLAIPAAANAAGYTPITFADDSRDVVGPTGTHYPVPALDIVAVHGERYLNNFSVVVTYRDLAPTTYTRHLMYLADSSDGAREKVIELRTSSSTSYLTTSLYYVKPNESGTATIAKVACSDARAVPDYKANTIKFTMPVKCYGLSPDSAILAASSGKWLKSSWQTGVLRANDQPNLSDTAENTDGEAWVWTGTPPASRSAVRPQLLF